MKYIIVLGDGMADEPIDTLGYRTPLEAADTPAMDRLARTAETGMALMVPKGMAPGSDTANLSVLGYDPRIYYSGRSSLEALSIGVPMGDDDISYRCNLVTLSEEEEKYADRIITDHSSDEIETKDATVLLCALKEGLKREGYEFYPGTSYRHLLLWKHGKMLDLTPPHDILTKKIGEYLPEDPILRGMMEKSYDILSVHPLNIKRKQMGLHPANSAWFWGAGRRPALRPFLEKTGKRGAMISAVDLLKGIARGAGMDCIAVKGATGGLSTNYSGKMEAARNALLNEGYDFTYIHVEAPDEMGHQGKVAEKIMAIEAIDHKIIGPLTEALDNANEPYRILVLPDHPTPVRVRTHTPGPVPYLLYDSGKPLDGGKKHVSAYNEKTGRESGIVIKEGYRLIDRLFE